MSETTTAVKQRYQEVAYMKVGESFELAGTGFTELNEEPNAQTTSKKYINSKSSSSSITSYEGEHPFTADQIPSEEVIKDLISIGKKEKQEQMQNVNLFALIWMKKQREIPLGQYSKHVCLP